MARTDETAVTAAIDTDLNSKQVNAFIEDASLWVDEFLASLPSPSPAPVLAAIEKYLACHLITLRDPRLKSVKLDKVSETYQRDSTTTEYLKQAAALDKSGTVEDRLISGRHKVTYRVGSGFDSKLDLPAP